MFYHYFSSHSNFDKVFFFLEENLFEFQVAFQIINHRFIGVYRREKENRYLEDLNFSFVIGQYFNDGNHFTHKTL